ncbi:uncharacterized protein LOC116181179 isoform X2 [Photinus pyralis]|uniref:uncharacterized protein LOC116181179 isoform X2 n=1 Tax=Photinus pyralis TaxID=7054 RepID=UPI0012671456|nr:uncharacterized protein LOC116181179 isoform X2 [Photinus pyralis]
MLTAIRTVHQACSECFIMRLTLVVYLLTLLTLSDLRSPEVYESVDEAATGNTNRTGNFASISQQDRRKWRYLEQQVVDARHQARNRAVKGRKPSALRKRDLNGIHPISLNNALTYVGDKEDQISVLNSLLGKAPLVQLQELQQMLSGKDHTPIIEDVVDIENPLTRPNVKTDPAPPELQEAVANTFAQSQFKHPSYGHVVLVQPRKNSVFRQDNVSTPPRPKRDSDFDDDYDLEHSDSESAGDQKRYYIHETTTDRKPINYIVINNSNDHHTSSKHEHHKHNRPKRKHRTRKRPHFRTTRKRKRKRQPKKLNKLKYVLGKIDGTHG